MTCEPSASPWLTTQEPLWDAGVAHRCPHCAGGGLDPRLRRLGLWVRQRVADRRSDSMRMSATMVRRGPYGMFAGGLLAFGSAAIVMPVANAVPDNCSQSGIATTASSVSATTAA